MLRLRTFGGLWIEGAGGVEPPSPAPAPRRLALLAVLAAAGPRGASRERLLGILWPDGEEERGRHALVQTVYSLRRDLKRQNLTCVVTRMGGDSGRCLQVSESDY